MNKQQLEILKKELDIEIDENQVKLFDKYSKLFLEKNSLINLISKNDANFLFEKHIFDSLAINLYLKNEKREKTLLDIGTGGGFPAIPIAIVYPNLKVFCVDSIRKKIKVIDDLKSELNLQNLFPICDRVENLTTQYDIVTARAVSSLDNILQYAIPKINKNGHFIAYKSQKAKDEIAEAKKTISKLKVKEVKLYNYFLPLEEVYDRNLIVFGHNL